jgi:hypothetical protein
MSFYAFVGACWLFGEYSDTGRLTHSLVVGLLWPLEVARILSKDSS